jgi:putative Holliday junction resolvase
MPDTPSLPSNWQEPVKPQGVALGFDYGTKKIGVAVGQLLTRSASPLSVLYRVKNEIDWISIGTLIKQWRPFALVVGIPLHMDGKTQWITAEATAFALALKDRFQLPVYIADERLTSAEARSQVFECGGYKALKKTAIDSLAAKLILEQWLAQFEED